MVSTTSSSSTVRGMYTLLAIPFRIPGALTIMRTIRILHVVSPHLALITGNKMMMLSTATKRRISSERISSFLLHLFILTSSDTSRAL